MNIDQFEYQSFPNHVFFGRGSLAKLPKLIQGDKKVFLIASPRLKDQVEEIIAAVGDEKVHYFPEVIQHVPSSLVDKALSAQKKHATDLIIGMGGGSAIGLAKAMALKLGHQIIAVPSTFSGSEMTNIWGISAPGQKTTGRDIAVLPRYVIYDPVLTLSMPKELAAKSAMNAMAHLIEAVYAPDKNPITRHNSLLGIRKLLAGMNLLADTSALSPKANELILFGAFLAGKGLCEVAMSLHHKAAHTLGGSFGMDHASVHTVLQAYVLDYQWDSLPMDVQTDFKEAFQHDHPPLAIHHIAKKLGAPTTLQEIGFKESEITAAVNLMLAKPYPNPKPLEEKGLVQMLKNAFRGTISE